MGKYLVIQTDFGINDGAVSAMYGVAYGVSDQLTVTDLTHGITPFDIFEGSFRLSQTVGYWPKGTVFVSVVDPGVGSERLSIAIKLKTGQYVVTPDNGTITHLAQTYGIEEARVIDENKHRLPGSENSMTFHGRDVYAYNGARLAAGVVQFEELGETIPVAQLITLPLNLAQFDGTTVTGNIDITDVNFGSPWTNISRKIWVDGFRAKIGDKFHVKIFKEKRLKYDAVLPYARTFADVNVGAPLIYINSVYTVGLGIRTGSFVKENKVAAGSNWSIEIKRA